MVDIDLLIDRIVENHNELSAEELAHYGTLGMKWGIRKDRSKPSTGIAPEVKKKPVLQRTDVQKSAANKDARQVPMTNRRTVTVERMSDSQKSKASSQGLNANDLSLQQLRDTADRLRLEKEITKMLEGPTKDEAMQMVINRIKIEQEYKRLTASPPSKRQIFAKKTKEFVGSVAETQLKNVVNAFVGKQVADFLKANGLGPAAGDVAALKREYEKLKYTKGIADLKAGRPVKDKKDR